MDKEKKSTKVAFSTGMYSIIIRMRHIYKCCSAPQKVAKKTKQK